MKIIKKAASFLYNRFPPEKAPFFRKAGLAPLPRSIHLLPTMNCNLNCVMCPVDKRSDTSRELKPRDYENIISQVKSWWARPYFYILGGEPLVYGGFEALIDVIAKNDYDMLINTNGMLLSRFAERLVDDHVKTVIVSIDGRQKHHEEIRRKEGLFQEVLAGMRDVNRIKKRRGCAYPKIDVSTVILPQNYKELYEFLEDMDRLGVRSVTLDHLKFITRDQYEAQRKYIDERFGGGHPFFPAFRVEDVDKIGIGRDDLARQMERIERDRHKFGFQIRWARNFTSEAMADYYCEEFSGQADNMFCTTIFNCLTIGPYGDMSICYEYPLGNIADLSIREAWNGDRARLLRRSYLERRHGFPACTYCTNLNPR